MVSTDIGHRPFFSKFVFHIDVRHRKLWHHFDGKSGNTFPAIWILIIPFLTSHFFAAALHAAGNMVSLPAPIDIATASSRIQR
jgi:hypothetical protein